MENNLKFETRPISDLFTEDEWNNFQIETWQNANRPKNLNASSLAPITVSITISKLDHYTPDTDLG